MTLSSKFNEVQWVLDLKVTETKQYGNLLNRFAPPEAKLVSISYTTPEWYKDHDFIALTETELREIAFSGPLITFKSAMTKSFNAPNNKSFTVKELIEAIVSFEKEDRLCSKSEWFGGIDVHHVFFEGLGKYKDGMYEVNWGS